MNDNVPFHGIEDLSPSEFLKQSVAISELKTAALVTGTVALAAPAALAIGTACASAPVSGPIAATGGVVIGWLGGLWTKR